MKEIMANVIQPDGTSRICKINIVKATKEKLFPLGSLAYPINGGKPFRYVSWK